MASTRTCSTGVQLLTSILVVYCFLCASAGSSHAPARKLLQLDPSVCPSELGFTACFSPDGSSLKCVLDGCGGSVFLPVDPNGAPQAVREGGTILVNFFTALGTTNYALYQTAVEPFAAYYLDYGNSFNSTDGQSQAVFNALKKALKITPGADYHSIFKVTDANALVGTHGGFIVGLIFTVNYPAVNPTLTFHFTLQQTSPTPPHWQFIEFYYLPYQAP